MRRQLIGLLAVLVTGVTVGIGPAPTHTAEGDSVTGTVQFSGTPPARPPVNFGAEQQCALMHADKTPLMEDIVVNDNGIPLKCDVHFWMTGYLHVLAHPFFAVTGEDGSFTIPGLPAGTYTLEAWHGVLGTQTAEITVGAGSSQSLSLTFGGS